jgi:hypothetical protein
MYVMGLKIEGFVFLPDTPGKVQSSSGRMEEKDNILYCVPGGSQSMYDD